MYSVIVRSVREREGDINYLINCVTVEINNFLPLVIAIYSRIQATFLAARFFPSEVAISFDVSV